MSEDQNQANARWAVSNNKYFAIASGLTRTGMEPGIYNIRVRPTGPWFLEKERENYDFPFKIYGTHDHIISRTIKVWENTEGNLSILFNGLKGTGKTVSAQLLANFFIERGFPVIVVKDYVDFFDDMLAQINQDVVLLFDEFEKNFPSGNKSDNANLLNVDNLQSDNSNNSNNENVQQKLLSTIDGLSRSKHRRLFLFTTNNKKLDPNMVDRPSRIRYIFEFDKLSDNVVKEVLEDTLKPNCKQYMDSIMSFVDKLNVVSMDAIKVVAQEVNIFEEPPENFKHILNLKEKRPEKYNIYLIDPNSGDRIKKLDISVDSKRYEREVSNIKNGSLPRWVAKNKILIKEHLEDFGDHVYAVNIKVPWKKTWLSKLPKQFTKSFGYSTYLFKQNKPENFSIQNLLKEENVDSTLEFIQKCIDFEVEYGIEDIFSESSENILYFIEFEPSYEKRESYGSFYDSAYDI